MQNEMRCERTPCETIEKTTKLCNVTNSEQNPVRTIKCDAKRTERYPMNHVMRRTLKKMNQEAKVWKLVNVVTAYETCTRKRKENFYP